MKILLVEDSVRLQKSLGTALRKNGYVLDITGDGKEGLWMAESNGYDVVILDIMLPGLDGLSVLKHIRENGQDTHILILTAKDTVEDRVRGLMTGADDYLTKPFALNELLARVAALIRRCYGEKKSRLEVGNLRINTDAREVTVSGEMLPLTPREYKMLEYLTYRKGQTVSRTEIEEHIYDSNANLFSNVVDSTISTLRKKLAHINGAPSIITRRGMGYILKSEKI